MSTVILFHHALGLTLGFIDFAERLSEAGHLVHTPDLYDGEVFAELDRGVAHAEQLSLQDVTDLSDEAVRDLPSDVVYAGFSFGALPAQYLAQTRPGAKGALLYHGAVPSSLLGGPWPPEVPLQIHSAEADPYSEIDVLRELADEADDGELFLYPGASHLFADSSYDDHDEQAATLLFDRTIAFLERITR